MSSNSDSLLHGTPPDRVFYATGTLLDARDFRDEQTYHRGRLAKALAYLHGGGTLAGLKVEWEAAESGVHEERLKIQPGVAIDRIGRIIEIPREACIRLDRWYQSLPADALIQAFHPRTPPVADDPYNGVVVDVFVRFVACERGKTPTLASGPFDSLDAMSPSRLRDAYQLELIPRPEDQPPFPQNPWPELATTEDLALSRTALKDAMLSSWKEGTSSTSDGTLDFSPEHVAGQDPTALFLARLVLPATAPSGPDSSPGRTTGNPTIDNHSRAFVYPPSALARWVGI